MANTVDEFSFECKHIGILRIENLKVIKVKS